jgi:hypothetical protein
VTPPIACFAVQDNGRTADSMHVIPPSQGAKLPKTMTWPCLGFPVSPQMSHAGLQTPGAGKTAATQAGLNIFNEQLEFVSCLS